MLIFFVFLFCRDYYYYFLFLIPTVFLDFVLLYFVLRSSTFFFLIFLEKKKKRISLSSASPFPCGKTDWLLLLFIISDCYDLWWLWFFLSFFLLLRSFCVCFFFFSFVMMIIYDLYVCDDECVSTTSTRILGIYRSVVVKYFVNKKNRLLFPFSARSVSAGMGECCTRRGSGGPCNKLIRGKIKIQIKETCQGTIDTLFSH